MCVPATQCGLYQGGDSHTEEDGPYELASSPLIKSNTHRLSKEERHRDRSTETCQVVLQRQEATEYMFECFFKYNLEIFTCMPTLRGNKKREFVLNTLNFER